MTDFHDYSDPVPHCTCYDYVTQDLEAENEELCKRLRDFLDYFNPKGGVSDVPLGPFERAQEALNTFRCEVEES
jgi:hypothetical protein